LRGTMGRARSAGRRRLTAAITLLTWGAVDQVRYYLALHDDNLPDLQRAAALNAYDSSLEMRLARKELDAGKPEAAEAAWKRAIQARPLDPAPRNAFLQFLTSEKRFGEAYDLTGTAMEGSRRDGQLLMNHGILAMQLGKTDEALKSWQNALATDPALADAQLYLAAESDREGKPAEAATHYGAFLEIVAHHGAEMRPPAPKLIGVALKLADCQNRPARRAQALLSLDRARRSGAQTGEGKRKGSPTSGEARVHARSGRPDEALRFYQRALQPDATMDDRHNEAVDWYN